jgi:hypothetical protein
LGIEEEEEKEQGKKEQVQKQSHVHRRAWYMTRARFLQVGE